jgi:hypothetical protein
MEAFSVSSSTIVELMARMPSRPGLYTAFAAAALVEAVIHSAKERLGLNKGPPPPKIWSINKPRSCDFRDLDMVLAEVAELERTPLVVCDGKEDIVNTYLSYQLAVFVDMKKMIWEVFSGTGAAPESSREKTRQVIANGLHYGRPIVVRLANTKPNFKQICDPDSFTEDVFDAKRLGSKEVQNCIMREKGAPVREPPKQMPRLLVTSDWNMKRVADVLPDVLPFFDEMAVVLINADSIDDGSPASPTVNDCRSRTIAT